MAGGRPPGCESCSVTDMLHAVMSLVWLSSSLSHDGARVSGLPQTLRELTQEGAFNAVGARTVSPTHAEG